MTATANLLLLFFVFITIMGASVSIALTGRYMRCRWARIQYGIVCVLWLQSTQSWTSSSLSGNSAYGQTKLRSMSDSELPHIHRLDIGNVCVHDRRLHTKHDFFRRHSSFCVHHQRRSILLWICNWWPLIGRTFWILPWGECVRNARQKVGNKLFGDWFSSFCFNRSVYWYHRLYI